jgi:hypothetical protein
MSQVIIRIDSESARDQLIGSPHIYLGIGALHIVRQHQGP